MNDNEITTIVEGCDPERCTDRVGGEHAETCAIVDDVDERALEFQVADLRWEQGEREFGR